MKKREDIILMSKLATYDKNMASEDWQKEQYFRHDYIYKKNMWMRFFVFIGCTIVLLFYGLHKIAYENVDVYSLAYRQEGMKVVVFFVLTLIGYTLIGTFMYTKDFQKSKRRMKRYFEMLNELDRSKAGRERVNDIQKNREVSKEEYGADVEFESDSD